MSNIYKLLYARKAKYNINILDCIKDLSKPPMMKRMDLMLITLLRQDVLSDDDLRHFFSVKDLNIFKNLKFRFGGDR